MVIYSPFEEPTYIGEKLLFERVLDRALCDLLLQGKRRDEALEWFESGEESWLPYSISFMDVCDILDIDDIAKRQIAETHGIIRAGKKVSLTVKKRYRVLGDYSVKSLVK